MQNWKTEQKDLIRKLSRMHNIPLHEKLVTDEKTLEELENEPTMKVYRAAQIIDGKIYPPMSAKINGKLREPIELGKWERSEEYNKDEVGEDDKSFNKEGKYNLRKGNGKVVPAAYNPYFHTSDTMLNDQFSEAQSRPNLITLEVEIPVREVYSEHPYHAEGAKDSVGKIEWKAGVIQSQLTGTRTVYLSRYDKPLRIVPDDEVARSIVRMFNGKDVIMPTNVVTPSLRGELEKLGVEFVKTDNRGILLEGDHAGEYYAQVYGNKKALKEFFNSLEDKKYEEQIYTPEFKEWFGDWKNEPSHASKVVDENNRPLVVYHSSDFEFDQFATSEESFIYHTNDADVASAYVKNGVLYEDFLRIVNPLCIDARGYEWNYLWDVLPQSIRSFIRKHPGCLDLFNAQYSAIDSSQINYASQKEFPFTTDQLAYIVNKYFRQYDGIIISNIREFTDVLYSNNVVTDYIVFKSNQVKSAVDNNGEFSIKSDNIRESRLTEADRARFINANPNLSQDQKSEIINIFKKYDGIDKDIKWGSKEVNNWNYENFKPYLDKATSNAKSNFWEYGLRGIQEGKDYVILDKGKDWIAYQPLTYRGSVTLASNSVGPKVWTRLPGWARTPEVVEGRAFPFGRKNSSNLYPGAKWCIAMQTSSEHWDSYSQSGVKFIFVFNNTYYTKTAISVGPGDNSLICYWDEEDNGYDTDVLPYVNLDSLIEKLQDYPVPDYIKEGVLVLNEKTGRYDYQGLLKVKMEEKNLVKDGRFIYPLGDWAGSFDCSHLDLVSLEGAPQDTTGDFYCTHNELTSLEGGPIIVGGSFVCGNNNLISLEGGPSFVGEHYSCYRNKLVSLKGAPRHIYGDFDCDDNLFQTLEGGPERVSGSFSCARGKLTSLKGAPPQVLGCFNCRDNYLTTLEGSPKTIGASFDCSGNELTTLKGGPTVVRGSYYCYSNYLTSLEGAPERVGEVFDCSGNELTTLKGGPVSAKDDYRCESNYLENLEGGPRIVGGNFECDDNPGYPFPEDQLPKKSV